jgi:putative hydrolase
MSFIKVDTHTHTLVSTHAHSTLNENIKVAKDMNLEGICLTNHGPSIPDAPHIWHFYTLRHLPKYIDGIRFFRGSEANIIDYSGNVDLPSDGLAILEWNIASIHNPCLNEGTIEEITNAYIGALNNPYIHCLGHIGQESYLCDFDKVVKTASQLNKIIEINNHSFHGVRKGSDIYCKRIAEYCKRYETKIVVSSDAHFCLDIGIYDDALKMLLEIDFPEELIINTSLEKFENYLKTIK